MIMDHVICDQVAIYRDWASVFARFGYRIELVDDLDDNPYFDSKGYPTWWATISYWEYDLHEAPPQEIWLDTGDWGMSLTGDPAKRHLDLLHLEQFLLRRGLPWTEPVDPLHEIIRAARLLPFCASIYTASDRAAVLHAWLGRMRDLAADLFDDDQEAEEFTYGNSTEEGDTFTCSLGLYPVVVRSRSGSGTQVTNAAS